MEHKSRLQRWLPRTSYLLLQGVLVTALVTHFTVVAFSMLPANPLSHQYKYQLHRYMDPWFSQAWTLFAPNPIAVNQRLLFQYEVFRGGQQQRTGWVDVVEPLTDLKKDSYWSPVQRILKHISASTNGLLEVQGKAIKFAAKQDTLAGDTAKTRRFVQAVVRQSPGHRALLQYSRHTFGRLSQDHPAWRNADSVRVRYRIMNQEFPRFSKRELDYFNERNSRYTYLTSETYRLPLAHR